MPEDYQNILTKLERGSQDQLISLLEALSSLCQHSSPSEQSKYSMQIVTTLNQILPMTELPLPKIIILEIMCSVVDKCKSVTPRALYQLDLAVKLLGDQNDEIKLSAQVFLFKYIQSYLRMDDLLIAYVEGKQYHQFRGADEAIIQSFKDMIRAEPRCITYCEDNQLLFEFIKNLLRFEEERKYGDLPREALVDLVNSPFFYQIHEGLDHGIAESLDKYFVRREQKIISCLSSRIHVDLDDVQVQEQINISEMNQSYLLQTSVASAFRQCRSQIQLSKGKSRNNILLPRVDIVNLDSESKISSSSIFKGLNEFQMQLQKNAPDAPIKYIQGLRDQNKLNIQKSKKSSRYKQNLDTSIMSLHNPLQKCGSMISLLSRQSITSRPLESDRIRNLSLHCSRVASQNASSAGSQEQVQPLVIDKPINLQLQSALQQIIDNLEKQDLSWDRKYHFLTEMRTLLKENLVSYLPDQMQNVLIDLCYDRRLSNCLLAFWGLQHLAQSYILHLKKVDDIQSICLMKLSDININIRNACRKVLYTFGTTRTLEVVEKLYQKYPTCSYYRKKEVLQLIAELSYIMKESDAIMTLEHISYHMIQASAEEYRAFQKILYFQNQRFGPQFRRYIEKYLNQAQMAYYNELTKPSAINLAQVEEEKQIQIVIEVDQSASDQELQKQKQKSLVDSEPLTQKEQSQNYIYSSQIQDQEEQQQLLIDLQQDIQTRKQLSCIPESHSSLQRTEKQYQEKHPQNLNQGIAQLQNTQIYPAPSNNSHQTGLNQYQDFQSDQSSSGKDFSDSQGQSTIRKSVSGLIKLGGSNTDLQHLKKNKISSSSKDCSNSKIKKSKKRSRRNSDIIYVKKQDLIKPSSPSEVLSFLLPKMRDCQDWKGQFQSLNELRSILHLCPQLRNKISQNCNSFIVEILKLIGTQRYSLVKTAIITIQQLCEFYPKQIEIHIQSLMGKLFQKAMGIYDFMIEQVKRCLQVLCWSCSSSRILNCVYGLFLRKNVEVKVLIVGCLREIACREGMLELIVGQCKFVITLQYLACDSEDRVRRGFKDMVGDIKDVSSFLDVEEKLREQYYIRLCQQLHLIYEEIHQ